MANRSKHRKAASAGKSKVQVPQVTQLEQVSPATQTTTVNQTKTGESKIMALTPEEIQALLGKTRQKGQYTEMLTEFVNSGDGGVCANEQWVAIRDKKATTVKQGFVNAIEKSGAPAGAENVKVISNEDKVYLINLAAADVPSTQQAAA